MWSIIVIVGAFVVGGVLFIKQKIGNKKVEVDAKVVECIRYWDLFDFYKSPVIQEKLAENPNLKLCMKKEVQKKDGKTIYVITSAFFDSSKEDFVLIENPLCLASENLDDILAEKINGRSVLFMRDAIL